MIAMSKPSEKKLVRYSDKIALWTTLTIIVLVLALNAFSVLRQVENQTIDFRFNARGPRTPQAPVKIIAIDEKSIREIGQWPWPRAIHAQIVRKLKEDGVKCVFYDVQFSEPETNSEKMLQQLERTLNTSMAGTDKRTDALREKVLVDVRRFQESHNDDAELGAALKEVGNVYLLMQPIVNKQGRTPDPDSLKLTEAELFGGFTSDFISFQSLIMNIPVIQDGAKDQGHTRCFNYGDETFRYYPTVINYRGKLIPHLSLQVARGFLDDANPVQIYDGKYAKVGKTKIPILNDGQALINYCGPTQLSPDYLMGNFPTYSVCDVLYDRIPKDVLRNSIAAVGATADGLDDVRPTSFTRNSPGIVVNACVIENTLSGNVLRLASEPFKYLFIIFLAFAMWYLVPRLTPVQGTAAFLILFIGYVLVSCLLFTYSGLVIDVTHPVVAMTLCFGALTTYKFRTEVRHGRHMKNMFQSMVTPKVVDAILKMPSGIELGGEEKELTVMFSDIRGFTTYSEKHTAKEVIGVLNEYLTQMTNMVFVTEGTLDKYIGDAIMAFWGAPVVQEDHAYRACSTALGMTEFLHDVLWPKWKSEGKEKLEIGIGLNTGNMVVGFVGSQAIKNYTLIGDAVNLGSRLEGTTKEYHVEIIISEATHEMVKMDMLCRELDLIQVKGKTKPIRIYELVDRRFKAKPNVQEKVEVFAEGLALYRNQKWDEATGCFQKCLELDPQDGPGGIFLERCKQLKEQPPAVDWDGVFVMKTK
jgi:adenylate cyclase